VDEERALYLAMIVTGSPPLAIALARGADLGVGPTVAGLVVALGGIGLLSTLLSPRTDPLLPRARSRKRHR
jgi:hypothetical protein